MRLEELARKTGVSARTVARDVERLRLSGVPVEARRGRDGGVRLVPVRARIAVETLTAAAAQTGSRPAGKPPLE